MTVVFRNVDVGAEDPVESWPNEAVQTVLERGSLKDWRRLAGVIRSDPWGPTARQVEATLRFSRPYGVAELMEEVIASARRDAEAEERSEVAGQIRALVAASGLSRAEFASRIGTSASRLSTYLAGRVTPSAALVVRMRRVGAARAPGGPGPR